MAAEPKSEQRNDVISKLKQGQNVIRGNHREFVNFSVQCKLDTQATVIFDTEWHREKRLFNHESQTIVIVNAE